MDPVAGFTQTQFLTEIHRGIVETVADRPDDSPQRRRLRQLATIHAVTSFLPRDAVETMLAGHCVIFDNLFRDGARDLLRGQAEPIKLRARGGINATGKMFLSSLDKLQEFRARPLDQTALGVDPNLRAAEPPASPDQPRPAQASPPPAVAVPVESPPDSPADSPIVSSVSIPDPAPNPARPDVAGPTSRSGPVPQLRSVPWSRPEPIDARSQPSGFAAPPQVQEFAVSKRELASGASRFVLAEAARPATPFPAPCRDVTPKDRFPNG